MSLAFLALAAASPGPDAVNASRRGLATYPWTHYVGDPCNGGGAFADPICMADDMHTTVDVSRRPSNAPSVSWITAVRCCWVNNAGTKKCDSEFSSSHDDHPDCYGAAKTYYEAKALCEGDGRRLCSVDELSLCCGTGCNYDTNFIWTHDVCNVAPSKLPPLPPPPPEAPPSLPPPPPPPPTSPLAEVYPICDAAQVLAHPVTEQWCRALYLLRSAEERAAGSVAWVRDYDPTASGAVSVPN